MVCESRKSRDVYTKRVLVEKHTSAIVDENPRKGHAPSPFADAHVFTCYNFYFLLLTLL